MTIEPKFLSMNIIIVNDFAHINGGASQVALSSAIALANQGYSVTLFSAVPPVMSELNHKNIQVICTGQYEILKDPNRLRATIQGIWNIKAAKAMKNLLDTRDPSNTIIHIHGWTKALSSSVVNAVRKKSPL